MFVETMCALLSIFILLFCFASHPDHGGCGEGWWVNGVRPDGRYGCRPRSLLPDHPSRGHEPDDVYDADSDHEIYSRIYCTGGTQPIVVDFRTVGCQRP